MAAAANMPNIKSGRLLHISELDSWAPDEIHGTAVRILGRVVTVDVVADLVVIEYHGKQLDVHCGLLGDYGRLKKGTMFQFLGELERRDDKLLLRARLCRDMTGLDSDLFDRCLKVRRDFEKKVVQARESQN